MALIEYSLPSNFTIAGVNQVHADLEAVFDNQENDSLQISVERVTRADTAGIQLLVAARYTARERSIEFSWKAQSAALNECAELLGLKTELGL